MMVRVKRPRRATICPRCDRIVRIISSLILAQHNDKTGSRCPSGHSPAPALDTLPGPVQD